MPYRNIDEAVIAFTLDEITWCNQQASDLLGYKSPEHLIGIEPFILVSDEHYFDLLMGCKTAMSTGVGNNMILSMVHRNEYPIPCIFRYAYDKEESVFYAFTRQLVDKNAETHLIRFIELVKEDIKTPDKVIEGNAALIRRMSLNRHTLAQSLSEIKYSIEAHRKTVNEAFATIPEDRTTFSQR